MNAPADLTLQRALLPNEPCIANDRQAALTERHLLPALGPLRALFEHVRAQADAALAAATPRLHGKPYPLGQSRTIALAAQRGLQELDPARLSAPALAGLRALATFMTQGGDARVVWGALRGRECHHALLLGTLCVDVAHDAAVSAPAGAPPVAVLPFRHAALTPVRDHRHYALLTAQSLGAHVYPNHVLPLLAPFAPLIVLVPGGGVRIETDAGYLLERNVAGGFASAAHALDLPPMADDLFNMLGTMLAGEIGVAAATSQGKARALQLCARYRDEGRRDDQAMRALLARANGRLEKLQVS